MRKQIQGLLVKSERLPSTLMRYALMLLFLLTATVTNAQSKKISGKVVNAQGNPVTGVSVALKGKTTGVVTDADGTFTINAAKGQTLVFDHISYDHIEVIVADETNLQIELKSKESSLNDVVVVGYGKQRRGNLTGAVATVDVNKTLGSRAITDVSRGLQGAVAGLTITTATGDLGQDPKIRLRGLTGSLNTGTSGAKPLILVDNVEIPSLQMINPDDIESISVLKDAASASIYGTRGAWGVILITTKNGKKGAPTRISYSNNFAWATPTKTPELANAADNSEASLRALQRFNPNTTSVSIIGYSVDSAAIAKMRAWQKQYGGQNLSDEMVMGRDFDIIGGKLYFYRQWDPAKMYMNDWSLLQRHDISVSGGSDKTTFNLGLGYMGQNGVLKVNPDVFNRYNFTLGVNSSVTSWLDVRGKILYSNTTNETPFIYSATQYGPWYYLYRWPANYPYGTYQGKPFRSAITEVQQAKMDEDKNNLSRVSVGGTFKIIPGLTFDVDYTYTNTNEHLHQTGGGTNAYDFWSFNGTALNYTNYQSASYNKARYYSYWNEINTGKAFATYTKDLAGGHSFKAIVGSDIEISQWTDQSSERRNLLDPNYGEISLATGDQFVAGNNKHWSTLGFFGRINYAYKNKYLLEVNGRYDGSSRFPVNQLWGFFPSMSAGYVMSEESYFSSLKNTVSFLKLRGSYGSIGNQAVGNNRFLSVLGSQNSNWILPSGNAVTVTTPGPLSPSLTWETVNTADLGLDARFLKGQFGLTFDWFKRVTSDMISPGVTLPSSFGATSPVRNYGELTGKGWELAMDYTHTFKNGLHFTVTASISDAQETITKYANTTKTLPAAIAALNTSYYEGMKIGEIWGFETDRLFTEADFDGKDASGHYIYKKGVPSQSKLESGSFYFGPGDVKYKDLNGDSTIYFGSNTLDDHGDKKIIGNSTPRYQYGFRIDADWKNFDIGIFFQGVGSRQLWASGPVIFPGFRGSEAWYANQMDYWTPTNTGAFYPRPTDYGATVDRWDFQPQTKYLLNLAYLRLKSLTFGYTLPKKVADRMHLNKLRVYFNGENLLTFDHLGNIPIDPEIDFNQTQLDNDRAGFGRVYPYRKTVAFGLQVTF